MTGGMNIGEVLRRMLAVSEAQIERGLARQRETQEQLGEALISLGFLDRATLVEALKIQSEIRSRRPRATATGMMRLVDIATARLYQKQDALKNTAWDDDTQD